jgi:hypothetical protein
VESNGFICIIKSEDFRDPSPHLLLPMVSPQDTLGLVIGIKFDVITKAVILKLLDPSLGG